MTSISLGKRQGFTLIELLVVIVIISILASVIYFNFVGVNSRKRDAQRKSDLHQFQAALELYRQDNGSYPYAAAPNTNGWAPIGNMQLNNNYQYMVKIPVAPNATSTSCTNYIYATDGNNFTIFTNLENQNDTDVRSKKPPPAYGPGSSNDGNITYSWAAGVGSCPNTYNYWVTSQ